MNTFYVLQRKDGTAVLCGNSKEAREIEEYKGSEIIGIFETPLNILQAQDLFKRRGK